MTLKIEHFETHHIGFPFQTGGPYSWGRDVWDCLDAVLLRLVTDDGVEGWGEAWGLTDAIAANHSLTNSIGPAIIGQDASNIKGISSMLQEQFSEPGFSTPNMQAISAVDIALWDIAGKIAGVPLHQLFGDSKRKKIPFFASLFCYEDADIVSERAADAKAEGFAMIKLHELGEEEIREVRNTVGPEYKVILDLNGAWEGQEAFNRIQRYKAYDPYWYEEPISPPNDFETMAKLRAETKAALSAGENAAGTVEFARMIEAGAVDYVQTNVTKAGGITVFREVVDLASKGNVIMIPHSPMFGPGLLASLHLSACLDEGSISEWLYYKEIDGDIYNFAFTPDQGSIKVPGGLGLGSDPDMDIVREFTVATD
jgi:L-alanine-DL-glutamate epimerase-like enolase superfamily enzyme